MAPFILKIKIRLKKHTYKSENTYITLFYSNNFLKVTIFIESIHTNPKHHYNPFYTKNNYIYNQIKKHTYESENTWRNVLLIAFSNIKKSILTNLKISETVFLLIAFSNIKKSILTNLKTPLFILIIILKETIYIKTIIQTILIKTIIQIDKHKAKYIITACIPKLL